MKFNPKHHQLRTTGTFVRGPVQAKGDEVLTPEQVDTMTAETIADEVTFGRLVVEDIPPAEETGAGGGGAAPSDPEPGAAKPAATKAKDK